MKYSDYKKKMSILGKVLNVIYKLRFPIIGAVVLVTAGSLTLTGIKGKAQNVSLEMTEIPYGTPVSAIGSSIFGDAEVEYSKYDEDNWSTEVPDFVGKYKARAVSYNGFGQKTYSAAVEFEILPKPLEIKFTQSEITYGSEIKYTHNLEVGEKISNFTINYGDNYYEVDPFNGNDSFVTEISFDTSAIKILDEKEEDISVCYAITPVSHPLTIKKRDLHIVFDEYDKGYDGFSLANSSFRISDETPLNTGDKFQYKEYKEILIPGALDITKDYEIVRNEEGKTLDRTNFYNVTFNTPNLTINKLNLEVSTNSIDTTYNGEKFSSDMNTAAEGRLLTYSLSANLDPKHEFVLESFASEGLYKPIENATNQIEYYIKDKETGEDITDVYYNITENFGTLNVDRQPLEISYLDFEEEYSRQTIKGGVTSIGLVGEDKLIYTVNESSAPDELNKLGEVNYTYDFKVENIENGDVTECYEIIYKDNKTSGTLKIKEIDIILESNSIEKTYDGYELSSEANDENRLYVTDINNKLLDGHRIVATFFNEGTLFVNGPNSYSYSIIDEETNEDVTYLYNVNPVFGTLTTKQRNIKIDYTNKNDQSGNYTFTYDGQNKTAEYLITCPYEDEEPIAFGDVINFNNDMPTISHVGVLNNFKEKHNYSITRGGADVSDMYKVEVIDASVTINKRKIKIKLNSPLKDKTYDGYETVLPDNYIEFYCEDGFDISAQFNINYSFSQTSFKFADDYEIFVNPTITDLNGSSIDSEGYEYNDNFIFEYENNGVLQEFLPSTSIKIQDFKINKRKLTLSTYTAEKVYDGTPLTSENAKEKNEATDIWLIKDGEGLADNDFITVFSSSSITNAGNRENTITYDIQNDLSESVKDSYEISESFGRLTVTPADLKIEYKGESSFTYDNQPKMVDTSAFEATGLMTNHTLVFNKVKSYTNVDTIPFQDTFGFYIMDEYGNDVTDSYKTTELIYPVSFSITKRNVTLSFKTLEVDLNYNFSENPNNSIDWDNTNLSLGFNEGCSLTWVENAKEYVKKNEFPPVVFKVLENVPTGDGSYQEVDKTSNYEVSYNYADTKRGITTLEVEVKCPSDYVGEEEPTPNVYYYASNLPAGYKFSEVEYVKVEPFTEAKDYEVNLKNTDQIKIYDSEGEDKTDFFKFASVPSSFVYRLSKYNISLDSASASYDYDGKEHYLSLKFADEMFLGNRNHHVEVNGEEGLILPGTKTYAIDSADDIIVKNSLGEDVTKFYTVTIGSQIISNNYQVTTTVEKININLSTPDISKTFDGKAFSANDFKRMPTWFSISNLGSTQDFTYEANLGETYEEKLLCGFSIKIDYIQPTVFDVSKKHVFTETDSNKAEIRIFNTDGTEFNEAEMNEYFNIEYDFGDVSIKPRTISYTTINSSKQYDGEECVTYEDLRNGGETLIRVDLDTLPEEIRKNIEDFSVYLELGENTFISGTYVANPNFTFIVNGEDLIAKGDIILVPSSGDGTISQTIGQTTLDIYNTGGNYTITKRSDDPSEELIVNGLVSGDILYVGGEEYVEGKLYYDAISNMRPSEKGTYVYGSNHISSVTFKIYRNGIDVTSCYKIRIHWSDVTVTLK